MRYEAPEQIDCVSYGKPVDIWAAGLIMYDTLFESHLFEEMKTLGRDRVKEKISSLRSSDIPDLSGVSKLSHSLMKNLIVPDQPSSRYKAIEALKHPWILN